MMSGEGQDGDTECALMVKRRARVWLGREWLLTLSRGAEAAFVFIRRCNCIFVFL